MSAWQMLGLAAGLAAVPSAFAPLVALMYRTDRMRAQGTPITKENADPSVADFLKVAASIWVALSLLIWLALWLLQRA